MKLRLINKFNVGAVEKYPSRVFLSVIPTHTGFIGVCREYDPDCGNSRTELRLLTFTPAGFPTSDQFIGIGEDPRFFQWDRHRFVLTWLETGRGDWTLWLINVDAGTKVQLKIEPWIFHGKNWVPVIVENRLLILRSLDPLVVLEADEKTGLCRRIFGPESSTQIGQYRGGGPAHYASGLIRGFGHRTHNAELHTVFHYTIDMKTWTLRTDEVEVIGAEGLGIIDPTSSWPGHCVCCATKTFWWKWQPVLHGLFRLEVD